MILRLKETPRGINTEVLVLSSGESFEFSKLSEFQVFIEEQINELEQLLKVKKSSIYPTKKPADR